MSLLSLILSILPSSKADTGTTQFTSTAPINIAREILAIAQVENSAGKIGEHGERGRLQFTATRWYQFSHKPHRWAGWKHPFAIAETERVERVHVENLIRQCQVLRLVPTPYTVALLHTAGFDAVCDRKVSALKKDFAQRVENVYDANSYLVSGPNN